MTRKRKTLAAVFLTASLTVLAAFSPVSAATLHVPSTPDTVHRGVISPDFKPVITIKSGDTVTIDTVSHAGVVDDPAKFFAQAGIAAKDVLPDVAAIAHMPKPAPIPGFAPPKGFGAPGSGHVLTGPIYIDGAEPGDMLEIRILKVTPRVPYGVNSIGPGGASPNLVEKGTQKIIKYDIAKKTVNFADGVKFPMRPFMGIMAVADTKPVSSKAPGRFGGNMDFEKLQAGSTLYLPVLVKGGLFVTGDSHAGQGDGEVTGNAIEASMAPTLQFIVHKGEGKDMTFPYVEDAQNYYILGMDPDLSKSLASSIKETVKFLGKKYGLSPTDAYSMCSAIIDFGIAQVVDLNLTTYGKIPKSYFAKKYPYWKS
ncbi:MAG TPA: acetamidase/formamidase family protein [Rhizomicrobium sp.]|nr:acetamidase/formamidase family protein [Rhizomicrobium sp.]